MTSRDVDRWTIWWSVQDEILKGGTLPEDEYDFYPRGDTGPRQHAPG